MKKIILTVALCCSFCAASNAIWLPAFFAHFVSFVSAWDEDGDCFACKKTGDPAACKRCHEKEHL
jgi:hypothetical protein